MSEEVPGANQAGLLGIDPARLAGIIGVGAGVSVLAGWTFDVAWLRALWGGWPPTAPLCALALLGCGVSLIAHTLRGSAARLAARAGALAAILLGLLTCTEDVSGALGIDRQLFAASLTHTHQSGRVSPYLSLALLCFGSALVTAPRLPRCVRVLNVTGALLVIVAVFHFATHASWLGSLDDESGAPAIIGLLAVSVGMMRLSPDPRSRSWMTMPAAVTISLAVITAAAATAANNQARRDSSMRRDSQSARVRTETINAIEATIARLQDIAASATEHWPSSSSAFDEMARGLLSEREISGVGLIDYVHASQRKTFERRSHQAILTVTASGLKRRAPASGDYFVSRASVHRAGQPSNIGVDIGIDPRRRAALLIAARTGEPQATAPVHLFASSLTATAVYVPVYRQGMPLGNARERLAALRGFIASSYRYDLLAPVLREALPTDVTFSLADGHSELIQDGHPRDPRFTRIAVAGRSWTLAVGTPPAEHSLLDTTLLVGGLLTLLLGALSLQAARRERYALALVARRLAERERAERALAVAEERFRTSFEEAPIGMALIHPAGEVLQVNRALTQITGYRAEQLLELSYRDLTHPEDRSADTHAITSMIQGEMRVHDVEKRLLHAAGHIVWAAVHSTLVRDERGEPAYLLVQIEDITARRRYELRLQHMADHDPLTGLLNRRAFERLLEEHIKRGERYGHDGAVIMLDLDDFKQVNDTLGHSAGDELIVRVGKALSARLRDSDVIARLGGDEFAILLPCCGALDAEHVAASLLQTIRNERAARGPGGRARPITASIGVACLQGAAEISAEEILINADLAMYDAKEAGRDRSETYQSVKAGPARVQARLQWMECIRSALEEQRMVLYAQPVLHTASGRITQYELLVRMIDERGEVISPGSFLPIAERFGLIGQIDRWVVCAAIRLLGERQAVGHRPKVEINLSGHSLGDRDLAALIREELHRHSVLPTQLVFEVTETTAIGNIGAAQDFAHELARLGCRFALDDFGAGFGSFYYLKHLPFDFIKIDGEFIRNCTSDATDRLVIRAVVELAKGMGKRTIAEFVADEPTLVILEHLGVDYAQGYYLGEPAPVLELFEATEPPVDLQILDPQ